MAHKPSVDELRQIAQHRSVEYELQRWYRHETDPALRQTLAEIQRIGQVSRARSWLNAMRPEVMFRKRDLGERVAARYLTTDGKVQVGAYSLGQRLSAARRWAQRADVDLAELAREMGLEWCLEVLAEPEPEPIPIGV